MDQDAVIAVVDVIAADRVFDGAQLVFEYMAATCAELGWRIPASSVDLPDPLRAEVDDLAQAYPPPGSFFVAYRLGRPVGCVGLQVTEPGIAEVKRLYVREAERGSIWRLLMETLHQKASQVGLRRLVLDVAPSRGHVIEFYRDLGYVETEPFTDKLTSMIYMTRTIDTDT